MNSPNPALVTQRAAQRLPRLALLLFCAAYLLPGLFGRDPWRNADITAFGYMVNIANGKTGWLSPTVGGLAADAALLPYWLGAASIKLLGPWLDPAIAARIPFALLLVLVLVLTWYATYQLARTEAAQPLPFAFGGEADPVDYARAIADGALLALIASLGLLQLGHETTPELGQLASVALYLYALAASPFHRRRAALAAMLALPALAASGAPTIALALGVAGVTICRRSGYAGVRGFAWWVAASTLAGVVAALLVGAWGWRIARFDVSPASVWTLLRQLAWFTWPAWPLALWTLWRWRRQLLHRHIAIPLSSVAVNLVAWIFMGGSDRALMLSLPGWAALAAFALPTLQRSTAALIDWASVFFFSICAIVIWVIYTSMHTGVPPKPAANIERLAPGYVHSFSTLALAVAIAGTLAWLWLVKWRTGRNRHAIWKSLVLPASGVALSWLLVMTLLLPPLDHARSYRSLVQRVGAQIPPGSCVAAPGVPRALVVALEYFGKFDVDAATPATATRCAYLVQVESRLQGRSRAPGWRLLSRERRNNTDNEVTAIYRREPVAR